MDQSLTTWRELKRFADSLSEEQLDQDLLFAETERPLKRITMVSILDCDYINPTGECAEPITAYLPGSPDYDPDFDATDEAVVAEKGTIILGD